MMTAEIASHIHAYVVSLRDRMKSWTMLSALIQPGDQHIRLRRPRTVSSGHVRGASPRKLPHIDVESEEAQRACPDEVRLRRSCGRDELGRHSPTLGRHDTSFLHVHVLVSQTCCAVHVDSIPHSHYAGFRIARPLAALAVAALTPHLAMLCVEAHAPVFDVFHEGISV